MSARALGLALALITLLAYLPATRNGFVNLDDDGYVTANRHVQAGLTAAGAHWAFTTGHFSNWHPLTWLSHMADCQMFRLNPAGHHLASILFHAANAALLFILLYRLTGARWPAAFVAALFAWHPLHVESVAWVSERKDVLSTFFALLALLEYEKFARPGGGRRHYFFALFFFALGLMAKPMVVTLPFVMLLLDWWPLARLRPGNFLRPVWEKVPFLLLAAVSCVVTFLAQRGEAVVSLQSLPLGLRLENVATAYVDYLLQTFWPVDLAAFYPLSKQFPAAQVALAVAVLIAISAAVLLQARRRPYLAVGWFWFLGTLVPVIGLVQVGDQARADRYTYFPLIGIFLMAAFGVAGLARRFQIPRAVPAALGVLVLAACLALTERQITFWRDSETLFTHALAVTRDNAPARLNLGTALQDQGRADEALVQYRAVLRLDPRRHEAYNNIGRILNDQGRPAAALEYCQAALALDPKSPGAHDTLGIVLAELGRNGEAMAQFTEAVRLAPDYAPAHFQMGRTLLKAGQGAAAVAQFKQALELDPENLPMLIHTARVLAADPDPQVRDGAAAVALARRAENISGGAQPVVLDTLAMACAEAGDFAGAVQNAEAAVRLAPAGDAAAMRQRLELYRQRQPWRGPAAR